MTATPAIEPAQDTRRKGPVEQIIDAFVNGIIVPVTSVIPGLADSGVLFGIFALLWIGFGVALVASQGSLDAAWAWLRGLPLILQGVVWLLFLPVTFGLWVWETTWPLVVRLILVAGVAGWNLLVFLPRAVTAAKP
jgi:hypothetical protein